ncbi:hypothetical protein MKMG_01959 [Methanogenium sp. MK-MG]|nr:hypothetical protein MKMG_01959 [Methanogenium sp. MK-MG]
MKTKIGMRALSVQQSDLISDVREMTEYWNNIQSEHGDGDNHYEQ